MKKYHSYLLMFFLLIVTFGFNIYVSAKDYGISYTAYRLTSQNVCDPDPDEDALQGCFEAAMNGELDSYLLGPTDFVVKGDLIMVMPYITVPGDDSDLQVFVFDMITNPDEATFDPDNVALNEGVYGPKYQDEEWSIFPPKGSTKTLMKKTDWTTSLNPVSNSDMNFFVDSGTTQFPLVQSGYIGALLYTIGDVPSGQKITISTSDDSNASGSIPDGTTNPTDLTKSFDWGSMTLQTLSTVSSDYTLKKLGIRGNVGTQTYEYIFGFSASNASKMEYNVIIPNSVNTIKLEMETTDTNAKGISGVTLNGNKVDYLVSNDPIVSVGGLQVGDNSINISVTSEEGTIGIYKLNVRKLSSDTSIKEIETTNDVDFGEIIADKTTYTATVPYKTSETIFNAQASSEPAGAKIESGLGKWELTTNNTSDTVTTKKIIVRAEDYYYSTTEVPGNVKHSTEYTFNITRKAPSKNVNLSDIKIDGTTLKDFSKTKTSYDYGNVSNSTTKINLNAIVDDNLNEINSITINGNNVLTNKGTDITQEIDLNIGDNTIIINVLSEDGTTNKDYKINVHRLSNESLLSNLIITTSPEGTLTPAFTPTFDSTLGEYEYNYDSGITTIYITATVKDTGKAKVRIEDANNSSNEKNTKDTLNTSNTFFLTNTKKVNIIVTAEDNTTRTYVVNLKRQKSTNNYLKSLSINPGTLNEKFQPTVGTYTATVPADTEEVQVFPALDDTNSTYTVSNTKNIQFGSDNQIIITVTSESGAVNTYTIKVTRELYDIATLDSISYAYNSDSYQQINKFNKNTFEYTLSTEAKPVPFETTKINIKPELSNRYATYDSDSIITKELHTGNNQIQINVTSQDGKVKNTYTLNVYRAKNTDNNTKGLTVAGIEASLEDESNPYIYRVELPNEKNELKAEEVEVKASSDATIIKTSGNITLSTKNINKYYYTVTSESGEIQNYTINITRTKSNNANASRINLYLEDEETSTRYCVLDSKETKCTIEVPTGTNKYKLEAIIDSEATVNPDNNTEYIMSESIDDSTQIRTLQVTAEDGTTKTYQVIVNRTKSSNANLSNIKITDVTNDINTNIPITDFNVDKVSYNITVPSTTKDIKIEATTEDEKASILTDLSQNISLAFDKNNQITIQVRAENNKTTKAYVLNITRSRGTDDTLSDLKIDSETINDFNKDKTEYIYTDVPYNKTTFDINAVTTDLNANVTNIKVNGKELTISKSNNVTKTIDLITGKNEIEITVTAHDTSIEKTYKITVNRALNNNTNIDSIKVKTDKNEIIATKDEIDNSKYYVTVPNEILEANNSNVIVELPAGARDYDALAKYNVTTTSLDTLDEFENAIENNVIITVTAEDGTIKTYNLIITRTPSDVHNMIRVNAYTNKSSSISAFCLFENKSECTINVDVDTTEFRLEGILTDSKSKVEFTDGNTTGNEYQMPSNESLKTIIATVTAENKTSTGTYTIKVKRAASSNNYLKTVETNADKENLEQVDDFTNTKTTYEQIVPGTQDEITIHAITEDEKSSITSLDYKGTKSNDITFTSKLNYGKNNIVITVTAENDDIRTYTLTITRKQNIEPRLSMIYINGNPIDNYLDNDNFDSDKNEYTLKEFPYTNSSINITADSVDNIYGTQSGTGNHNLQTKYYLTDYTTSSEYVNDIEIKGIAHDTSIYKKYTLHIKRAANNNTAIDKVEVEYNGTKHQLTYNSNEEVYEITVPNEVTKINKDNFKVTVANPRVPETDAYAKVEMNETELKTNDSSTGNINTHKFTVVAEDGTKKEYTAIITREKSNIASLTDMEVVDPESENIIGSFTPSFKEDNYIYTVNVPVTTTKFKVNATKKEANSIVSGDGEYTLESSNMKVEVSVSSEDGKNSRTYTLNIVREASNDNSLKDLTIEDEEGNSYIALKDETDSTRFKVEVPGKIDKLFVNATPNSNLASVSYVTLNDNEYNIEVGQNILEFKIKSESGATQSYYIEVTRKPKNDATLQTITYTIGSGNATLIEDFDPNKYDYDLGTVDYGTSIIYITAVPTDPDATIKINSAVGQQSIATGPNKYTITVVAQDGITEQEYTISIERSKNNVATLNVLSITGEVLNETWDKDRFDYTMTVDETKSSIKQSEVTAIPTDRNAKVTIDSDLTLSTSSINYYKIIVTAEDGITTKTYTIAITRPKSTDATLKDIKLTDATISPKLTKGIYEYTITVPYGKNEFEIEGIPNVETSDVYTNGVKKLEDGTFTLTVQAESGNTQIYKFNVVEAKSTDATLSDLSVNGYPFTDDNLIFSPTTTDYSIGDIESAVEKIMVNATPSNADSTIKYYNDGELIEECNNQHNCELNLKASLGEKTITVEITAPDAITKKQYYITYNKVKSDVAYLSSITSNKGTFDKTFNKGTTNYELNLTYDESEVDLTFITESENASIKVNSEESKFSPVTYHVSGIAEGETKTITVIVTAQDGINKKTYTILVNRANYSGNNDAFLSSLSVDGYPFTENFKPTNTEYNIGQIPYALAELTINATTNVSTSKITYYVDGIQQVSNVVSIPRDNAIITVKVTAEDNKTIKTYNINYTKIANNNAFLSDIITSGATLEEPFIKDKYTYTIKVPYDQDSIDYTFKTEDKNATIKVNGNTYISGNLYTMNSIDEGSNTINIVVTAEDGKTTQTYRINVIKGEIQELITSINYGHTIENGYIKTVAGLSSVLDIKNQLDNDNAKLQVWKNDNSAEKNDTDKVGTGDIVKLIINNKEVDSKIIIIKGDINGDGKHNALDVSAVINHYLKTNVITDEAKLLAADVNTDKKINALDVSAIINHYLNTNLIKFK